MKELISFPKVIEIQFNNLCNSSCTICPYKDMHYDKHFMEDELFSKFLQEIQLEKPERIIPYLNNEPFTDRNFIDKLERLRLCYDGEIEISTNAALLDQEKIEKLAKIKLTELRISMFGFYGDTYKRFMPTLNREKVLQNIKTIAEIFKDSQTKRSIVVIDDGTIEEVEFNEMQDFVEKLGYQFCRWGFLDRAKNVAKKSNNFYNDSVNFCEQFRPSERIHILANGDVIFCCQDWSNEFKVGNIHDSTIKEIWNGKIYQNLRDSLFSNDKKAPELCCNCKLAHKK